MTKELTVIRHHTKNPDDSIDTISKCHKVSRSHVQGILDKHYEKERAIYIVPALLKDKTFFAFNGINEREFTVDYYGFVTDPNMFNQREKKELQRLGFKIYC